MPVHALHTTAVLQHLQEDVQEPPGDFISDPPPSYHDFSGEVRQNCVQFLRKCFSRYQAKVSVITSTQSEGAFLFHERHFLPVTPFHIALVHDDHFVQSVLHDLTWNEAKFVLTALVDYRAVPSGYSFSLKKIGNQSQEENEELERIGLEALEAWEKHHFDKVIGHSFQIPLSLAAASGKSDFVQMLLEKGANLLQTDLEGNNFIHTLVKMSLRHPKKAIKMFHTMLGLFKRYEVKSKLILGVNMNGQTPLDLASEECLPEMMHALINVDGIYRHVIRDSGSHAHFLYDVTHYEQDHSQSGRGLLHRLSVVTEQQLKRLDNFKLLEKEPFVTWLKVKTLSNTPHTRFWMVMWIFYVCCYLASVVWYGERREIPHNCYTIFLLTVSALFLVLEIKGLYLYYPYFKMVLSRLRKGLYPITFVSAYRIFQTCFILTVIVSYSLAFFPLDCDFRINITLCLHVLNVFFGFMSLMFFTQLGEAMGHYLTVIEKMITNTLAFLSLSFFIFTACAVSFYINYIFPLCSNSNNTTVSNTTVLLSAPDNPEGSFTTIFHSIYETFLLSLAVTAPKSWYFTGSRNPSLTVALYLFCLVVNTLVLLNLLIAIMNERVVEICKHKQSILKINQLSIYLHMEDRRKSDQRFFMVSKTLSSWADIHKHYVCTKDKTRIYLHVVQHSDRC